MVWHRAGTTPMMNKLPWYLIGSCLQKLRNLDSRHVVKNIVMILTRLLEILLLFPPYRFMDVLISFQLRHISVMTLTHWGRVTHICVSKLTIIGSDNGLSPGRRQAIIWINAEILLIRPWWTNFNEMSIEILTFSFMKMRLKVSSTKWRPFCLGLNVLKINGLWFR